MQAVTSDWPSLLQRLEARPTVSRADTGDEEDWRRRRGGVGREDGLTSAVNGPEDVRRFRRTGLPKRESGPGGWRGLSVAGILGHAGSQSDTSSIIGLFEAVRRNAEDDEERRRGGSGGSGGRGEGVAVESHAPAALRSFWSDRQAPGSASRAAIAAGAQPVVIKVISTVSSRASAAGLINYLGTRELEAKDGERASIPIFDGAGKAILNAEDRAGALADWVAGFREAYAVNSVVSLTVTLNEKEDLHHVHEALNSTFGAMPFLYARDGHVIHIVGVQDINPKKLAEALLARKVGSRDTNLADRSEARFGAMLDAAGLRTQATMSRVARNEQAGKYLLKAFLEKHKDVLSPNGDMVSKAASPIHENVQTIWNAWRAQVKPVTPRNAFHVVFSARAGTDAEAMIRAVRDFLSEQIPAHRWMTAHHPETRHVHVHAMIAARDDLGRPLRFTKPELRAWREKFAAKAREHGIAMVATRRADLAATRPYTQEQAGAVARSRHDPDYLRISSVRTRVERKQAGLVDPVSLGDTRLGLRGKWAQTAQALRQAKAPGSVIEAAERFSSAAGRDNPSDATPKGYLLLHIEMQAAGDVITVEAVIAATLGVRREAIAVRGKSVSVLAPTTANISRIEREIGKQNDEFGPGGEMQRVSHAMEQHLHRAGIAAAVTIEAAGSIRNGQPTPWLMNRFRQKANEAKAAAQASQPLPVLRQFIRSLEKQKERRMAISLEQFDERVARANRSMDRLEGLVDSPVEQKAVTEMRQEIAALFAEQRGQLALQNAAPVTANSGDTGQPEGVTHPADRAPARSRGASIDPAIAAQQAAIAKSRSERAAREQAGQTKNAQEEQRQQVLRDAEQRRQQQSERDGVER